jgi:hypothetical protein
MNCNDRCSPVSDLFSKIKLVINKLIVIFSGFHHGEHTGGVET